MAVPVLINGLEG